jgi:hypothetical protein
LATLRHKQLVLVVATAIFLTSLSLRSADRTPARRRFFSGVALAAENHVVETRGAAPAGKTDSPFEMLPGVIVDPGSERLYLMNPQGGIDALELASGKLLWTAQGAGKPLAAFDDRLAAQAEPARGSRSLPIALLRTKDGARIDASIEVPMPAAVMPPSIDNRLGFESSVDARAEQDGLLVWWTVTSRQISGLPRPASVRNDSGAALIDLQTYRATTLAPEQARARLRSATSSATSRLAGTEGLYFPPQPVGQFFVSVKLGPASAGQPAVLKRWSAETGEPLPHTDLGPGYVASSVSADQSLFLAVSRASTTAPDYLWSLYAIASGERVAQARLPDSAQPFFVWHSILIYEAAPASRSAGGNRVEEPLALSGLNLKTGAQIWKRALRDTSYHGSYPPQL